MLWIHLYNFFERFAARMQDRKFRTYFYFSFGFFMLLMMFMFVRHIAVMSVLLIANVFLSMFMRRFKKLNLGIEVVGFSTILTGMVYGAKAGAIFGALALVVHFFFMRRMTFFILAILPGYVVLGLASSLFSIDNLVPVGIALILGYNLFVCTLVLIMFNAKIWKCCWFTFTNVLFNYFLFTKIAPMLVTLM